MYIYEGLEGHPSRAYTDIESEYSSIGVSSTCLLIACLSIEHFTLQRDEYLDTCIQEIRPLGYMIRVIDDVGLLSTLCSKITCSRTSKALVPGEGSRRRRQLTPPMNLISCVDSFPFSNPYPPSSQKHQARSTQIHVHVCSAQKFRRLSCALLCLQGHVTKERNKNQGNSPTVIIRSTCVKKGYNHTNESLIAGLQPPSGLVSVRCYACCFIRLEVVFAPPFKG